MPLFLHMQKAGFSAHILQNYYYDIYSMAEIERDLQLNQRDLISLALLLGCDYGKEGVKYIGKQKAIELVKYFKKKSLDSLDRYF